MDTVRSAFGTGTAAVTTFAADKPYLLPAIAAAAALLLLGLIVIIALQYRGSGPAVQLTGPIDLFAPQNVAIVSRTETKAAMGASYTLMFYLRVDAVPDMRASSTPLLTWPGVWSVGYNAAQEQLVWTFEQTPDKVGPTEPETAVLKKVSAQRWHQIGVAFEGRTVELFLDGELQTAKTLNNVPPSANSSITIVPNGIMGSAAYVQVWPRRLTLNQVAQNYVETSDSQGQPYLGPEFFRALKGFAMPNLFCLGGRCDGSAATPAATAAQKWEFPYA